MMSASQEEIVAKIAWLGQKLGLVSKPKVDDDVDKLDDGEQMGLPVAGPSQPSVATGFPPAGPVGSFNLVGNLPIPVYAISGRMYPRYGAGGTGETRATGLKPGEDSPLTKRAAAALAATSDNKH